jgi:histidinol-phosphate/aromatic aminotransferase/cobyric acid decarboxylase-like protein
LKKAVIDLASNTNSEGPPDGFLKYVKTDIYNFVSDYPSDRIISDAVADIEIGLQLGVGTLSITRGATDAIEMLCMKLARNKKVLFLDPTFWEYEFFSIKYSAETLTKIPINNNPVIKKILASLENNKYDVVFICNPNNPTGTLFDREELLFLIKTFKDTNFVIDETYLWFSELYDDITLSHFVKKFNNLYVVSSLSKVFAVPGIRIGTLISSPGNIKSMREFTTPYSLSQFQVFSAKYLINNEIGYLVKSRKQTKEDAIRITKELEGENIRFMKINTCFVFVNCDSRKLSTLLKGRYQIREGIEFGSKYRNYARIKLWNKRNTREILQAIKQSSA